MLMLGLVLLASLKTTLACSCKRLHPQEHFCQDDYGTYFITVTLAYEPLSQRRQYKSKIICIDKTLAQ